ncbi:MAG: hypothetical protein NT169_15660 [Chloroflexi bacterium]|nr:hypothetical protein [Chloroflexota bacterium]
MIAIESVLFLLGGIVLAVVLIQVFGRGGEAARGRPIVRLVRSTQASDGAEETRLTINDQPILTASSEGLRLADYADEVERLETIATRIASALGGSVELARVGPQKPELEAGVPVRGLLTDAREMTERRSTQKDAD